jgi:hypothetical protein
MNPHRSVYTGTIPNRIVRQCAAPGCRSRHLETHGSVTGEHTELGTLLVEYSCGEGHVRRLVLVGATGELREP